MTNNHEVELKLEVDSEGESLKSHPFLLSQTAETRPQKTTYFDTEKGALRKAGFSLRVRSSGGKFIQTVKQAGDNIAGMFDRPEWETEIEGPGVDFEAVDTTPLARVINPKMRDKLMPVVTTDIVRTVWIVSRRESEIELNLDEGTIRGGHREQPLQELELELRSGNAATLMELARELAQAAPLRLGVMTKIERGLALADGSIDKARKADAIQIDPAMNVAESFVAIVHACLKHFRLNEPLVVKRRDAEALHQARVAMRRLRSSFSLFGPAVQDDEYGQLREELQWFTDQLGDARNLDVLSKRFETQPVPRRRLEAAREKAYDLVLEALQAQRFRDLMLGLLGWLEFGKWRANHAAQAPIGEFARERIDRRWRKVKRAGRDLASLEEEPRHRLRIDIKKLRYALEFLSSLYEPQRRELKVFIAALEEMQEELGYLNDIATARILIATIGGHEDLIPNPEPGEEIGHLAAAQTGYARLVSRDRVWRKASVEQISGKKAQ